MYACAFWPGLAALDEPRWGLCCWVDVLGCVLVWPLRMTLEQFPPS